MSLLRSERSYCLQLANGHRWNLIATDGAESWVDNLASIMELKPCEPNGHPKLIVTREDIDRDRYKEPVYALDPDIQKALPGKGWKLHDRTIASPEVRFRFWYHNDVPDVIYYIGQGEPNEKSVIRMWGLTYFIYQREQFYGGLPFHAGFIARNGLGVILSANGGIGKSTCCRRIPPPWYSPADDQVLVIRDAQGRYMLHPFPTWSEYLWNRSERTWNVEKQAPLSAIFFLQRAKDDRVEPIKPAKAMAFINESAMQGCIIGRMSLNQEELVLLRKRVFNNACELAKTIPSYILEVSLDGRFWEEIEKVL